MACSPVVVSAVPQRFRSLGFSPGMRRWTPAPGEARATVTITRVVLESTDLVAMLWHERMHRDPAHQWLREQIVNAL